jgi:hypothetical protein
MDRKQKVERKMLFITLIFLFLTSVSCIPLIHYLMVWGLKAEPAVIIALAVYLIVLGLFYLWLRRAFPGVFWKYSKAYRRRRRA